MIELIKALERIKSEAVSLADAQVIALEALRAALQDKAGEVRDARFWLEAIVDIWNDGDKAPEHRCYVEGAFSDAMREASALLAAHPAPVAPDDVARDAGWFRLIRDGSVWPAVFASHDAPEPLRGDDLDAAMLAASQQKGGQ